MENSVKQDLELGLQYEDIQYDTEEVTYESEVHVEDVNLSDSANVYFNVNMESESEHSEVLSLPSTSEETVTIITNNLHEQPLNLVKKDRKRKPSSIDGNADVVICKLCNSYVVKSLVETHNR